MVRIEVVKAISHKAVYAETRGSDTSFEEKVAEAGDVTRDASFYVEIPYYQGLDCEAHCCK